MMELSAIGRRYLKVCCADGHARCCVGIVCLCTYYSHFLQGFFTIDVISVLPIDYILVGVYGFSHSVRYARCGEVLLVSRIRSM